LDRINDTTQANPRVWTDGDDLAGIAGTLVLAAFMQDLQEELVGGLIEDLGLTPASGAGHQRLIQAGIKRLRTYTVTRRVLTSSTTYVPSANLVFAHVEVQGGGGGGGGATGGSGTSSAGGGGGSGGYARAWLTAAQIGASQPVTVGSYGGGSAYGNNAGGVGGTSSFGSLLNGFGAGGGYGAPAYTVPTPGGGGGGGGGASSSVAGALTITGQSGQAGVAFSSGVTGIGGLGGSTLLGFGGQQGFQSDGGSAPFGQGYGTGGAGAGRATTSLGGGSGAPGVVIVTEYCTAL